MIQLEEKIKGGTSRTDLQKRKGNEEVKTAKGRGKLKRERRKRKSISSNENRTSAPAGLDPTRLCYILINPSPTRPHPCLWSSIIMVATTPGLPLHVQPLPRYHSSLCSTRRCKARIFLRPQAGFRVITAALDDGSGNGGAAATAGSSTGPNSLLSFLCPLLKLFAGGDPSRARNDYVEIATSSLSSLARFPWGSKSIAETSQTVVKDSSSYLQLFEFEACPFCRRVREAMTELDLSAEIYPCPKGSKRHRELVKKMGGKEQFPFLVDADSGISMYESGEIVKYLFHQYGRGRKPSFGLLESTIFTGWVPTILRAGRGMTLWEGAKTDQPSRMLELFSYENNPYARIAREALCELELPYVLRNVGEGSLNAELLVQLTGSKEVPYLIDPNTRAQIGGHKKILSYLFGAYSTPSK